MTSASDIPPVAEGAVAPADESELTIALTPAQLVVVAALVVLWVVRRRRRRAG